MRPSPPAVALSYLGYAPTNLNPRVSCEEKKLVRRRRHLNSSCLQDMMNSDQYAPAQHETDLFTRCVADFMVKLLNTLPADHQTSLLSGL
jgi:hypothetical protein